MPSIEKIEQQLADIEAKRKEVRKQLADAKRREAAKRKAAERKQAQEDALAFVAFCKANPISGKPEARTIYDWVLGRMQHKEESS